MRVAWAPFLLLAKAVVGPATAMAGNDQASTLGSMLAEFSRCNVARHPDQARAYVLSTDDSGTVAVDDRPFDKKCHYAFRNDARDTFTASWYRNELAIALMQRDFKSDGPASLADQPPLAHRPLPDKARLATDLASATSAQSKAMLRAVYSRGLDEALNSRLGECLARSDPEELRVWVLAGPGEAGITTGSEKLRAVRDECVRDLGTAYSTNRGWAAYEYFRLAQPRPMPVQTGKW